MTSNDCSSQHITPANAGIQNGARYWVPAFAGTTHYLILCLG